MRPGTGHDGAEHQHQQAHRHGAEGQGSHRRWSQFHQRGIAGFASAVHQHHTAGDDGHRQQEMGRHSCGVQAGEHSDAAKDGLHDRADQRDGGQRDDGGAWGTTGCLRALSPGQGTSQRSDGKNAQDERQQSVAELHVLVPGLGLVLGGHERPWRALRPCGAAQARSGQAHQSAGDDDAGLRDEVGHEDPPQPGGCSAVGGGRGFGHVVEEGHDLMVFPASRSAGKAVVAGDG